MCWERTSQHDIDHVGAGGSPRILSEGGMGAEREAIHTAVEKKISLTQTFQTTPK